MHEIEALEKAWLRYRIKKTLPYVATLVVALAAGGYALYQSPSAASNPSGNVSKSTPAVAKHTMPAEVPHPKRSDAPTQASAPTSAAPRPQPVPKITPTPQKPEPPTVELHADTAFLQSFATHTIQKRQPEPKPIAKSVQKRKTTPPASTPKPAVATPPKSHTATGEPAQETTAAKSKSNSLVIQTKKTNNTLEYLIERFNQTRDPKLATYIAQSYYKKGLYKEAIRWSVTANSIDPMAEESWILFAKSKVKLGQRQDAINALRIYLNQYSSKKVKSLLQTIESGSL